MSCEGGRGCSSSAMSTFQYQLWMSNVWNIVVSRSESVHSSMAVLSTMLHRHCVYLRVVDAKARCSFLLCYKRNGWGKLNLWDSIVSVANIRIISCFLFPFPKPCTLYDWGNWSGIHLHEFSSVLYLLNWSDLYLPNDLKQYGYINKFVAISGIFNA